MIRGKGRRDFTHLVRVLRGLCVRGRVHEVAQEGVVPDRAEGGQDVLRAQAGDALVAHVGRPEEVQDEDLGFVAA